MAWNEPEPRIIRPDVVAALARDARAWRLQLALLGLFALCLGALLALKFAPCHDDVRAERAEERARAAEERASTCVH